jgi:hypothetical protein
MFLCLVGAACALLLLARLHDRQLGLPAARARRRDKGALSAAPPEQQ